MASNLKDMSMAFMAHRHKTKNPNDADFPMHVHDQLEIFYYISGNAHYLVEGNIYNLKPHDLMIMRQSEAHKISLASDATYERIAIHFQPAMLEGLDSSLLTPFYSRPLGQYNHYSREDFDNDHYIKCLQNASLYFKEWSSKRIYILGNTLALLGDINEAFAKKNNEFSDSPVKSIQMQIVEYVNRNLFESISLEKVSEHFFLSVSQTNRIFKKATGSTLWEYVIIKRLLAAREMILSGEQATIACSRCGFSDYSSFYRVYRKKFGSSPKSKQ